LEKLVSFLLSQLITGIPIILMYSPNSTEFTRSSIVVREHCLGVTCQFYSNGISHNTVSIWVIQHY
jgi:hypothetical protein